MPHHVQEAAKINSQNINIFLQLGLELPGKNLIKPVSEQNLQIQITCSNDESEMFNTFGTKDPLNAPGFVDKLDQYRTKQCAQAGMDLN